MTDGGEWHGQISDRCGENNRNPVSETGRTLTLGADGKPLDKVTK